MKYSINTKRVKGQIDKKIYGSFLEHFHRQVYGGIYDPTSKFADEDGLRTDVIEAIKHIKTPIIRWPGGCFVDDYHWKRGVGPNRIPSFDKNWRVEEPNTFGTDEFMKFCEKVGCEPYFCTNGGTATPEEASDWVEYCNLESEGEFAKLRIANGRKEPWNVKYWSIGNENYAQWQIGGMPISEWLKYTRETAKMMLRIDPQLELCVAATTGDIEWTYKLFNECGKYLKWVSVHGYWDFVFYGAWGDLVLGENSDLSTLAAYEGLAEVMTTGPNADYDTCMTRATGMKPAIERMHGLLRAMNLDNKIKIAFDEWNLRGWFHPHVTSGLTKEDYLYPRDRNDDNSVYTMADAVFTACFLNTCARNCDIVGMANFSPLVNTRGAIFTHKDGIVKRSTYHVFDLYANHMGDEVVDIFETGNCKYTSAGVEIEALDTVAAIRKRDNVLTVAVANKNGEKPEEVEFEFDESFAPTEYRILSVIGEDKNAYNDIGREQIKLEEYVPKTRYDKNKKIVIPAHSTNIIEFY